MTLEKLLGRNYKWFYIAWHALLSETGGKMGFLTGYLATILRIISTNYVWFFAKADSATFTYFLAKLVFKMGLKKNESVGL
jgi:hypothetical protein